MKKLFLVLLSIGLLLIMGNNQTQASSESVSNEYTYEIEGNYEFGYMQVISSSGNNYIIEVEEDGEWFYLRTDKKLYVGNWYIVVIQDYGQTEKIVDILPIERLDEERLFDAFVGFVENEKGVEFNEEEFLYWLSTENPDFYYKIMIEYYGYIYYNFE